MLNNIINLIQNVFSIRTLGSEMEEYIISKRPQSASDIERFEREYNQKISQGGWL